MNAPTRQDAQQDYRERQLRRPHLWAAMELFTGKWAVTLQVFPAGAPSARAIADKEPNLAIAFVTTATPRAPGFSRAKVLEVDLAL